MRMALIGAKQTDGFDIAKHNKIKHGSLLGTGGQQEPDQDGEEENEDNPNEGAEKALVDESKPEQEAEEEEKVEIAKEEEEKTTAEAVVGEDGEPVVAEGEAGEKAGA